MKKCPIALICRETTRFFFVATKAESFSVVLGWELRVGNSEFVGLEGVRQWGDMSVGETGAGTSWRA